MRRWLNSYFYSLFSISSSLSWLPAPAVSATGAVTATGAVIATGGYGCSSVAADAKQVAADAKVAMDA